MVSMMTLKQFKTHSMPAEGGVSVYFPAGKYFVSKTIFINNGNLIIFGQGRSSHITYTYEQTEIDTTCTASLFSFKEGLENIVISNLKLEYIGYFYPNFGESYSGKVNALNFRQCYDISIENIEISGFNANAVCVATGDASKYAKRFKVNKCYLHHNRVGGVIFGYVEQISITDCDLEYNGSVLDGGTGYGCAGSSGEFPKYIQIIGNRAMYNYRKGIDLHAGIEAIIEGNVCHGNRLYGIYTEGCKTGNVIIKGNIVSGMKRDVVGLPLPYTWIMGIDFGPYSKDLVSEEYHNYIIEGNEIMDFGLKEGRAFPVSIYYNFKKGSIQVKNNIFRTGRITNLIGFSTSVKDFRRDVKIDISGNQAFVEECTDYTIKVPGGAQISIYNNQISTNQTLKADGAFILTGGDKNCSIYTGNHVEDSNNISGSAIVLVNKDQSPIIYKSGNFLNGKLEV